MGLGFDGLRVLWVSGLGVQGYKYSVLVIVIVTLIRSPLITIHDPPSRD